MRKEVQVDIVYLFSDQLELMNVFQNLIFIPLNANAACRFLDFGGYKRLSNIIKSGNYDIVQANAGDTLKYAALSKMIFRWTAKLIFRNANKMSDFITNEIQKQVNHYFLRQCDCIISVSEKSKSDITAMFPILTDRTITIPIGTYLFDSIRPIREAPSDEPILINIGSLVPEKNHAFLIDVFYAYYSKFGEGFLWLVGDGKLRKELEGQVVKLGIEDRVKFWGYRKDVIPLLKSSTVLVMPSKIEGLPAVILESLSCGIPVVCSAVGGIPEVIRHGRTGYMLTDFSVADYLEGIQEVIHGHNRRNEIITNGLEEVKSHYLMDVISSRFMSAYNKLVLSA